MGGVVSDGGDGLNVELNLVPFIDLLSSLVLFLLLTAVWLQIATIPVGVDVKGAPVTITPPAPPMTLVVRLSTAGFEIEPPAEAPFDPAVPKTIAKVDGEYNLEALAAIIPSLMKMNLTGAAVASDDTVGYGRVIETLDILKNGGLPSVSLSVN